MGPPDKPGDDERGKGRGFQAERACDVGWEIAQAATPVDAYATDVKLKQLRWMAGVLAPRRFGRHRLVEAEVALEAEREAAPQPSADGDDEARAPRPGDEWL